MSPDGAHSSGMGFSDAMSETDVERLLSGHAPASGDPRLAELAVFVRALRASVPVSAPELDPALITRLAKTAAAGPAVDGRPSTAPASRSRSRLGLAARLGVVAAAIPALFAALAVAGVDLPNPAQDAFEKIGIELPNQADDSATEDGAGSGNGQNSAKGESAGKAEPRAKRQAHGPSKSANPTPQGEAVRRGPNPTPGTPRAKPDTLPSSGSNAGGKADGDTNAGGSTNGGGSGGERDFGQAQGK